MSRCWHAGLAALFAVVCLVSPGQCKPPDLPHYQNVTVLPHDAAVAATGADVLTALGLFNSYPIQLLSVDDLIDPSSPCGEEYEEIPATKQSAECQEPAAPGKCGRPTVQAVELQPSRDLLTNLELLEKAQATVTKAQKLVKSGDVAGAMRCLEQARNLVPHSPCAERIESMMARIKQIKAKPRTVAVTTSSPAAVADCGRTVVIVKQSHCASECGTCWVNAVRDSSGKPSMKFTFSVKIEGAPMPPRVHTDAPMACGHQMAGQAKACCPLAARFRQVPLLNALDQLRAVTGCKVVIDFAGMQKVGVSPIEPVSLEVNGMPLYCALDLMLRPHKLKAHVSGDVIHVTGDCPACVEKEDASACEEVCPVAAAMHAKVIKATQAREQAGKAVLVRGLMKACRLALSDRRYAKAADLARQAHAIDPSAVEADPMVIKLDLLNQYKPVAAPRPGMPTAAGARPVGSAEEAEEGADGATKLVPHLPSVFDVVGALEAIGRQSEALPKK